MYNKPYRFVIVSPRQHKGGSIVLHSLCKQLDNMGYDSSIFYIGDSNYRKGNRCKFWVNYIAYIIKDTFKLCAVRFFAKNAFINHDFFSGYVNLTVHGCKRHYIPVVGKNTIVIYPEVVYGNFLHAKKVVRWLLYYNKYRTGDYNKKDLFICYRPEFNDKELNPLYNAVKCPYFNLDLYRRTNYGVRNGTCYIIRKGKNRLDLPSKYDGIIIDNLSELEIVNVFNKCEICISYDTQTAYTSIAALCGCTSVVIPEVGKTADYYRREDPMYGIAYGFEHSELDYAKHTQHLVFEKFKKVNEECEKNAETFFRLCVDYFSEDK